ncbi:MAG: double zinc ribbon domain-containing protein, partial [Chloroflexota bacterium]
MTGSIWTTVIDFIFPPSCAGCGTTGSLACTDCQQKMIPLHEPLCDTCGQPTMDQSTCQRCTKVPPTIDKIRSAVLYTEPVTKFMHHFKYYDQFALANPLAEMMLSTLSELSAEPPDLLIPIPLHTQRERERG